MARMFYCWFCKDEIGIEVKRKFHVGCARELWERRMKKRREREERE